MAKICRVPKHRPRTDNGEANAAEKYRSEHGRLPLPLGNSHFYALASGSKLLWRVGSKKAQEAPLVA